MRRGPAPRQPSEGKRALHVGRKWQPKRWSQGSDPRLLRLTLDRLPDRASGERPRASKAVPYPKARLADCNLLVLPGALICIKQPGAEGRGEATRVRHQFRELSNF